MNDRVKGIVLNITDYKDNDEILKVYTQEYGLLSFIAKGCKKITSKRHYLMFNEYEFIINYKERQTIFNIINSKLLSNNYHDDNLLLISYCSIFSELIISHSNEYSIYDEILFFLNNINNDNMYCLGSLLLIKILSINGYKPYNKGCVVCNTSKVVSFSIRQGGFVCKQHLNNDMVYDKKTLQLILYATSIEIFDYEKIVEFNYDIAIFNIFIEFAKYNLNSKLKSYDFFKKVVQ